MIAAPADIGVEARGRDAERLQILPGRAVGRDFAAGRDVIGGDAVAVDAEHARAGDARPASRSLAAAARRTAARRCSSTSASHANSTPRGASMRSQLALHQRARPRRAGEHIGRHRRAAPRRRHRHRRARGRAGAPARRTHRSRPRRASMSMVTRPASAKATTSAGEHEIARTDQTMDAAVEIAVAGEHRGDRAAVLLDRLRHHRLERPRLAAAGRAAVADDVKAQRLQAAPAGRRARDRWSPRASRARARSSPRVLASSPRATAALCQETGADHAVGIGGVGAGRDGGNGDGAFGHLGGCIAAFRSCARAHESLRRRPPCPGGHAACPVRRCCVERLRGRSR